MNVSAKTIKLYINTGPCRLLDAICLIYGFEPSAIIIENRDNYRATQFRYRITELEAVLKLLCPPNSIWWQMSHSIFYYVEKTLRNNIKVSRKLINAIQQYTKNLTLIDFKQFQTDYSYIVRQFRTLKNPIIPNSENAHEKQIYLFTTEERNSKYQEIANKIWKTNPDLRKEQVAQQIHTTLSKENLTYLIDRRSEKQITVATILKNIHKPGR